MHSLTLSNHHDGNDRPILKEAEGLKKRKDSHCPLSTTIIVIRSGCVFPQYQEPLPWVQHRRHTIYIIYIQYTKITSAEARRTRAEMQDAREICNNTRSWDGDRLGNKYPGPSQPARLHNPLQNALSITCILPLYALCSLPSRACACLYTHWP